MDNRAKDPLDATLEITVTRLQNANVRINREGAESVGEFMSVLYKKLVEIYEAEDKRKQY